MDTVITNVRRTTRRRFAASFAAAAASIAIIPRAARAAEFEWKFGVDQGSDDPMVVRIVEAFGKIRDESGGQLVFKSFPNSMLGGDPAMLSQLRSGALESLAYTGTLLGEVVPLASVSGLGYAFTDASAAYAAFDGTVGDLVRKDIAARGMVAMPTVFNPGYADIESVTKPVLTVDQLAGMKVRVAPAKMRVDLVRSMGASPTPVSSAETYTALTTHVIEGVETSVGTIQSLGWGPALKYINQTEHRWECYWMLFNPEKWAALSPKLQGIVSKYLTAAALQQRRDVQVSAPAIQDKLQRSGLTFIKSDKAAFKAKLRASGYYERWKQEFGPAMWAALAKYSNLT